MKITDSEHKLLDNIKDRIKTLGYVKMPPGVVPNPTKKKLRPSSASGGLQSHPCYSTGLFDDNARPTTASASKPTGAGLLPPRPKTQAGGPRYWGKPPQTSTSENLDTTQRRLTIGEVNGIAETQPTGGRPLGHVSVNEFLKGKVSLKSLSVALSLHYTCVINVI